MSPNPQFPADLITFTEEILNGKLHCLCSDKNSCVLVCYSEEHYDDDMLVYDLANFRLMFHFYTP